MNKKAKIKTISLGRLRNPEWFKLMGRFWSMVRGLGAETLKIVALWEFFIPLYQEAAKILKPIVKSALTPELKELDAQRDAIYADFKKIVSGYVRNFDAAKADAAKHLMVLFDAYKNVTTENTQAESADIYNVLEELRGAYLPFVTTLGMTQWTTELDKANKAFDNKYEERSDEKGDVHQDRKIEDVREDLDWIYNNIIWNFETQYLIDRREDLVEFINDWNEIVQKFKTILAVREGRKKAAGEEEIEENIEQD